MEVVPALLELDEDDAEEGPVGDEEDDEELPG